MVQDREDSGGNDILKLARVDGTCVQWMVSRTTWMVHLMYTFSMGVNTGSYSFYV